MNPWESLAQGIDMPRETSSARRNRRWRAPALMAAHGVSTVAELRTAQVLRDNTRPGGFNFPVGRGYVYSCIDAQPQNKTEPQREL